MLLGAVQDYRRRMHELSFAEQVVESVQREAAKYPGYAVTRVRLRAGELLAIEPASLRFCLEAISVGTVMENAAIEMTESAAALDCSNCGRVPIESLLNPHCPKCGKPGQVVGADLIIEEIELDDNGQARGKD